MLKPSIMDLQSYPDPGTKLFQVDPSQFVWKIIQNIFTFIMFRTLFLFTIRLKIIAERVF